MIWVVDRKVVRHLITQDGQLAEVPIRVTFEYAIENGAVLDGTLSLKRLYNKGAVCRHFPGIDDDQLDEDVQATVERAVDEHLALSGLCHRRTAPRRASGGPPASGRPARWRRSLSDQ